MDQPSISIIESAIRRGLPDEAQRWLEAQRQLDYYECRGVDRIKPRPAETYDDFACRPKCTMLLTRRVINELSKGLYSAGPTRELPDVAGQAYLDQVLAQNHGNALLQEADALTWLQGVFAIQVSPTGRDSKPVRLYPWRADEFAVWLAEDDPSEVWAVSVRSLFPARRQVRYQLWTAEEVRTYWSEPGDVEPIGRGDRQVKFDPTMSAAHGLGGLPFVFCHNRPPVTEFWTPGLGKPVADANAVLDAQLSDLAQSIQTHCIPRCFSENVATVDPHVHRPGGLIDLIASDRSREGKVYYVQPDLQADEIWMHLVRYTNQVLTDLDLPLVANLEMQSGVESGVALVVRRMPLIQAWMKRQENWKTIESRLAQVILATAGQFYKKPELLRASMLDLAITYPEPQLPLPTPERNEADTWELANGLTSRIRVVQERYGLTRAQAVRWIEQTVEDIQEERDLYAPVEGGSEQPSDQNPDAPPDPSAVPADDMADDDDEEVIS